MPALILIGIPIAVVILFIGIMNLPDEDVKKELITPKSPKAEKKKSKRK